jgi:hypothetical protein
MIDSPYVRTFTMALLLAMVLGLGCNNRSRGRAPDSSIPVDSSADTMTGDTGGMDTGGMDTGGTDTGGTDTGGTDTGGTDTGMGGDGAAAVAGFTRLIEAECALAHRCRSVLMMFLPEATDAEFVGVFGSDAVSCVSLRFTPEGRAAIRTAVDGGTILYDAAAVGPCVSASGGLSCEDFWTGTTGIPACDSVISGTLPLGAICAINGECISGTCAGGMCDNPAP